MNKTLLSLGGLAAGALAVVAVAQYGHSPHTVPAGSGMGTTAAMTIAHTDAGSQYLSVAYTERLISFGMQPSVGSVGDALDKPMAEAFVGTIKSELIQGRILPSFEAAEHEILSWISFYNHDRLHEQLGHRPPAEFEALHRDEHPRPWGPPSTVQPALPGALAGRGSLMESL